MLLIFNGLDPKNWGKDLDLHIGCFVAFKLKNQFNSLLSEFQKKRCCFDSRESPKRENCSAPNSLDWLDILILF